MRIILYDDDVEQRVQIEGQLRQWGREMLRPVEVSFAWDREEFDRMLREGTFDLLVVTQSGADSPEIVKRAMEAETRCPVLWFSELDFAVTSYEYGVAWFGRKPVEQHILHKAIRRALTNASAIWCSGTRM